MKIRIAILLLFLVAAPVFAQSRLTPHTVILKNGARFDLNLPADLEIIPAAEGLKRVRFFVRSPDGRIFVTDMNDLSDNKKGKIYILDGWDAAKGKFNKVRLYMSGLRNPNSVQFFRDDKGQDWIYIAETQQLTRRRFSLGEESPTDNSPQILAKFPDYGLSYKYGGWHLTRTISFSPAGRLYVSVGSSCNACVEKEKVRASVISMNPDGSDQRELARGLRNAVGIRAIGNYVFVTNQGSDHLGLWKPDETFYALEDGADYGWPYCYSSNGKIFSDPKFRRPEGCKKVPAPYAFFPAHSSALGFDYFDDPQDPAIYKNAFVVALHGSTNKAVGHGYKIVIMRKGEELRDLVTGFLVRGTVRGRPCDIMKIDSNSFLFTDDNKGIIYLVRKRGTN
jgi:glucose/arabinose dehydrogenase